jgi:hypothetical protein
VERRKSLSSFFVELNWLRKRMNITLPDEIREELEPKAKIAGFSSLEKYVAELVHTDDGPIAVPEPLPNARYAVRT